MYDRQIDLRPFARHRSLFLLGPRQTGKSTLLRNHFPDAPYIDLLADETFRRLAASPESLGNVVQDHEVVVIDEIQKLPRLLDEVQRLIDLRGTRFLLTGSSARKLRRGRANLLGGRALFFALHPLISAEIGFDRTDTLLTRGGLPGIVDSPIHWEALRAYAGAYLREEIQAEALTRSIENFSRFLDVAAHFNGQQINYTKIGNDAEVPSRTIKDYIGLLQDTLVLHVLPPFRGAGKRKLAATDKVYLFDIGVANALAGRRSLQPGSPEYGLALEQLVFLELRAAVDYRRLDTRLTYWRTRTGLEVDFLLDDHTAVEVKATRRVSSKDSDRYGRWPRNSAPADGCWYAASTIRKRRTMASRYCRSGPSASGCGAGNSTDSASRRAGRDPARLRSRSQPGQGGTLRQIALTRLCPQNQGQHTITVETADTVANQATRIAANNGVDPGAPYATAYSVG